MLTSPPPSRDRLSFVLTKLKVVANSLLLLSCQPSSVHIYHLRTQQGSRLVHWSVVKEVVWPKLGGYLKSRLGHTQFGHACVLTFVRIDEKQMALRRRHGALVMAAKNWSRSSWSGSPVRTYSGAPWALKYLTWPIWANYVQFSPGGRTRLWLAPCRTLGLPSLFQWQQWQASARMASLMPAINSCQPSDIPRNSWNCNLCSTQNSHVLALQRSTTRA